MNRFRQPVRRFGDFGDMTDVRAVATIPPHGGVLHLGGCPKCRTQLGVRFGPDGIVLYIAS